MAGKPKYHTEEERLAARKASQRKYDASPKGRANRIRKYHSETGQAAAIRYRAGETYKARMAGPKVKKYLKEYKAAQRKTHPEIWAARAKVKYALKMGRMPKPDRCASCSEPKRVEAHHYLGYAEEHWLDVRWLCTRCHRQVH